MTIAVELTARAVRVARVENGHLRLLRTVAVEPGADPVQVLASALPPKPGSVRVMAANEEVLVRMLVQPPCPRDRLDRLLHFEMTGGSEGDDAPLADWTLVPGFGSGDYRILGLAVKRALVDRLRQAVLLAGGRLDAVTHPAVGMYHAWRSAGGSGDALLADVGGAATQVAVVRQDELAMIRSLPVGMDTLVVQIAEMRGMPAAEAARLVVQLRSTSPEELLHLVRRQAGQVAAALTGAMKFAKAQLQVDDWQPAVIALAGAGAQVHGFAEAVAERAGVPARPFNPFARLASDLPADEGDRHAALPSAWAPVLGLAQAAKPVPDALADERRASARFWSTDGALRVGAALAGLLVIAAVAVAELSHQRAAADVQRLGATPGGLVTVADAALQEIRSHDQAVRSGAAGLGWLAAEHRTGRIAAELLGAVASLQHAEKCPLALSAYTVRRAPPGVVVELQGWANRAGKLRTSEVLDAFKSGLRSAYPPIAAIDERPVPVEADRQRFHLVLTIPDLVPAPSAGR